MTEMKTYRVEVSPVGKWWEISVPELFGAHTQTRRITDAEPVARELIYDLIGLPIPPQVDDVFLVDVRMANPYVPNQTFPPVVLCDIDGTLANRGNRGPYDFAKVELDEVNHPVLQVLDALTSVGHEVILLSGRQTEYRPQTERWLDRHIIPYKHLYMRGEGDRRSDDLVKMELFDLFIRDAYSAWLMLDDRDRCVYLWRKLGLPCWQVAEGNF